MKDRESRVDISKPGTTRREFLKGSSLAVLTAGAPAPVLGAAPMPDSNPRAAAASGALFSPGAHWIWDGSDRTGYHHYIQARRKFSLSLDELRRISGGGSVTLMITADAYYQAWLNGRAIGEGPAKSAEGRRSVDTWDIAALVVTGVNELLVVALSLGVGTRRRPW